MAVLPQLLPRPSLINRWFSRSRRRLREAAVSYMTDPAVTRIVPVDGPVGEGSEATTSWITGLAGQPVRGLAVGAGVATAAETSASAYSPSALPAPSPDLSRVSRNSSRSPG